EKAVKTLPVRQAIFDGEVVVLRPDGVSDFQELQNALSAGHNNVFHYYIFDLLFLNGEDLRHQGLRERKELLKALFDSEGISPYLHFSEHFQEDGESFLKSARELGLEGIISKRLDRPYVAGRGYDWLKLKCVQNGEFVIGGYTDPAGSRTGFGALLVGYHDAKKKLKYAGKVGTGFDGPVLQHLGKRLQKMRQGISPFDDRKKGSYGTHWVSPKLVAQIAYGSQTREGILRHSSFQGLREDKPAEDVNRDRPVPLTDIMEKETIQEHKTSISHRANPKYSRHRNISTSKSKPENYDPDKQELAGVRLTSPNKLLYPEEEITKLELANYYRSIEKWILPHIANRPLVLVRCPEGRAKECFFQKHPAVGTPEAFHLIPIREKTKTEHYVMVDDVAGLISLAQIGALEVHAWGSRADKLDEPDRLIFDLDPAPDVPWKRVIESARQVRDFLEDLGLKSFVKTTGGKGLHLVVPINRQVEWDAAKAFCKSVADLIVEADPGRYTANMSKASRTGKIFIDYLRNGRGATAVAPYSPRSRPEATVSVPVTWEELTDRLTSDQFTIRNLGKRLDSLKRDPWEGIQSLRQGLTRPMKKLASLS
ncbi:MAG TPA: DNA ligase D, partial [Candidatus Kapabacteria bacterium]